MSFLTHRLASSITRARAFLLATLVAFQCGCARDHETMAAPGASITVAHGIRALVVAPLEDVPVETTSAPAGARLVVSDGDGRVYIDAPAAGTISLRARGSLGRHQLRLLDRDGRELARAAFELDAHTRVRTAGGALDDFIARTQSEIAATAHNVFMDGKSVRCYVGWLRDDTHVLEATRFFEPDLESLPEAFIDHQRDDGMVYDLFSEGRQLDPHDGRWLPFNGRLATWGPAYAGFSADRRQRFERVPVEADVEYLLVEDVFNVWQATGDDAWMRRALPACEKALDYVMGSPLRWSSAHGLVKRGFTIDTWDFQNQAVALAHPRGNRNPGGSWDIMWIDQDTPMCIMHGDNTGMFQACRQMATMCSRLGQDVSATQWAAKAEALMANLDRWCWNGSFYTHQVHLDPIPGDFGADESRVLSLSNAYALNRGIAQAKAVSIIREYQARREETKDESFAEWFTIHPSFSGGPGTGFAYARGDYMNGGVTTIVAGELARGAFTHGFESYGVDILRRVAALQERDGRIHAVYHPSKRQPDWKPETCVAVDLRASANRGFVGEAPDGWTGEGVNDLREFPVGDQEFLGHSFSVIDPAGNGGHAALMLRGGRLTDLPEAVTVPVGRSARSIYVLQACTASTRGKAVATYELTYADGTSSSRQLWDDAHISNWWGMTDHGETRVAWRGTNPTSAVVGIGCFGWNNPQPDKEVASITFRSMGNGVPIILGVSVSDQSVQWPWGWISGGIPDNWAAAAVYAAAIEGLAGISDGAAAFEIAEIAPRWSALGEDHAEVIARYGASRGYVAYRWSLDAAAQRLVVGFCGAGRRYRFHLLLPPGARGTGAQLDGKAIAWRDSVVETSTYVDCEASDAAGGELVVTYSTP